jgi:hypothetical protein
VKPAKVSEPKQELAEVDEDDVADAQLAVHATTVASQETENPD